MESARRASSQRCCQSLRQGQASKPGVSEMMMVMVMMMMVVIVVDDIDNNDMVWSCVWPSSTKAKAVQEKG